MGVYFTYILLSFILGYIISGLVLFIRINKQDKQINILNNSILYMSNVFNQIVVLSQQQLSEQSLKDNANNSKQ